MKRYIKTIDGNTIIKRAEEIVVKGNGSQTFNPTEEMILADGWEIYVAPVYVPTLEEVKANKVAEILAYDSSEAVNLFYINGIPAWLDKATRSALPLKFEAEELLAEDENVTNPVTELWYGAQKFEMPLVTAKKLLLRLELYASQCYNVTQSHIAEVQKMESKEAVEAYDYTTGYPAKLSFN